MIWVVVEVTFLFHLFCKLSLDLRLNNPEVLARVAHQNVSPDSENLRHDQKRNTAVGTKIWKLKLWFCAWALPVPDTDPSGPVPGWRSESPRAPVLPFTPLDYWLDSSPSLFFKIIRTMTLLAFFPIARKNTLTQNQLREGKVYFVSQFIVQSVMVGRSRQRGPEAADHSASTVRN